jgi:hypothetical protein
MMSIESPPRANIIVALTDFCHRIVPPTMRIELRPNQLGLISFIDQLS